MDICITYFSKYGNGQKVVEQLQKMLKDKGNEVTLISVMDVKPESLPAADLYVFSSPTHIGGPAGKMKRFLKKVQMSQKGTNYALITTCMAPQVKTLEKMESILQQKGMVKKSPGVDIKVTGMKGPLEEGWEEKLEEFATQIVSE